jgi:hypothetical protein
VTERPYGKRNSEQFQSCLTFSQLYAKASFPDICSIPIQANNAGADQGVSFDLNDTVVKIGRELNARRNARFSAAIAKWINNVVSDYL